MYRLIKILFFPQNFDFFPKITTFPNVFVAYFCQMSV